MFPAARKTDPITHDLLAPSGMIGPPISGPCPGVGPVLIEGPPAAHVTCTAVCTGVITGGIAHPPIPGPPPPIIVGSPTVFIHGFFAARWAPSGDVAGCGVFLGMPPLAATRTTLIGGPAAGVAMAGGMVTVTLGGMTVTGTPADVNTYLAMVQQEAMRSPTFANTFVTIVNDTANPVNVTLVRGDPSVWVDAYNGNGNQTVNLDYFDSGEFPDSPSATHPDTVTRGENLIHALDEAHQGAVLQNTNGPDPSGANWYHQSHQHAIDTENDYRDDRGQASNLVSSNSGPGPNDATFAFDNGASETHDTNTGAVTHRDPSGNVIP